MSGLSKNIIEFASCVDGARVYIKTLYRCL
jgi:hypothetical protein